MTASWRSVFDHPDAPGDGSGLVIYERAARQLEGQLNLAMMVSLVPKHVLQKENGMVVVNLHGSFCSERVFYHLSHGGPTVVQHLLNAAGISFGRPFLIGQVSSKLGSVLSNKDESDEVDMREHLRHGRAARHCLGFQGSRRNGSKQVDQNSMIPVPGIQQNIEKVLV